MKYYLDTNGVNGLYDFKRLCVSAIRIYVVRSNSVCTLLYYLLLLVINYNYYYCQPFSVLYKHADSILVANVHKLHRAAIIFKLHGEMCKNIPRSTHHQFLATYGRHTREGNTK